MPENTIEIEVAMFRLMGGIETSWVNLNQLYKQAAEVRKANRPLNKYYFDNVRNYIYTHCSNCGHADRPKLGSRDDIFERDERRRGYYRLRQEKFRELVEMATTLQRNR